MITQKELKELLSYDRDTGIFVWLVDRGSNKVKGSVAGSIDNKGYVLIRINKKDYRAHRLAWLYIKGSWPEDQIDHKNGIKNENRFCNLREANNSQNKMNTKKYKSNTSGFKGVHYRKDRKEWIAAVSKDNKRYHLGYFNTKYEAHQAYVKKAKELHKDFFKEK